MLEYLIYGIIVYYILEDKTSNYSRIIKGVRAGDQVIASYDQELESNQKVSIN